MFSHVLTQVTHIKLSLSSTQKITHTCQLLAPTLPSHLSSPTSSSLSLSVTRFKPVVAFLNTFWPNQLLVFCSTIRVSSYSNSYEVVTLITVVIC
ncbi:unnamed protein product [Hymenolepis diminuta]|uniref:Uncharacterized protein n=1 Tax=Hymenolepis diminuta TaxID=6216 RepID=A0A564YCK7_HYMDI|nr:unnamed protein product [Hymenolepis diminuta]